MGLRCAASVLEHAREQGPLCRWRPAGRSGRSRRASRDGRPAEFRYHAEEARPAIGNQARSGDGQGGVDLLEGVPSADRIQLAGSRTRAAADWSVVEGRPARSSGEDSVGPSRRSLALRSASESASAWGWVSGRSRQGSAVEARLRARARGPGDGLSSSGCTGRRRQRPR